MKRIALLCGCLLAGLSAGAQVTLDECRRLAREHYPEIRQYDLVRRTEEYTLSNARRAWLSQLSLAAQATWQTEVPSFPNALAGMLVQQGIDMPGMNKDQYKAALELNQTLWDGGKSEADKRIARAEAAEQARSADVDLYALQGRVDNLFFGILLLDERIAQTRLTLDLQKLQLERQRASVVSNRPDIAKQAASLREQIAKQQTERRRVENLLRDGAATTKQLDDIDAQIKVLNGQLEAQLSTLRNNAASIDENSSSIDLQIARIEDQLAKCRIASPVAGTVLAKYSEAGELASVGRPLMKVADLDRIYLRAYFTSDQLAGLKLGQEVTVTADFGGDSRIDYPGRIVWIASESEFTPKTIQTRDSRANLVYAAKIAVENDGRLKIGLYGEVRLRN